MITGRVGGTAELEGAVQVSHYLEELEDGRPYREMWRRENMQERLESFFSARQGEGRFKYLQSHHAPPC